MPAAIASLESRLNDICASGEGTVGVSVHHLESGERIGINEHELFPLCSTVKVPILVELMRQVAAGKCSLEARVELDPAIQVAGSGVFSLMRPGLRPTLYDCALLMIIISDNTGTDMCLRQVGVPRVGALMRELGLNETHITMTVRDIIFDVNGIEDQSLTIDAYRALVAEKQRAGYKADPRTTRSLRSDPDNNVGSPLDSTRLYEMIWNGSAISGVERDVALDILLKQQLNGRLPRLLPERVRFAHKTGSLPGVKNDAGILYLGDDEHVIISAFSKGMTPNSRQDAADDRLAQIGRAVYDHYSR